MCSQPCSVPTPRQALMMMSSLPAWSWMLCRHRCTWRVLLTFPRGFPSTTKQSAAPGWRCIVTIHGTVVLQWPAAGATSNACQVPAHSCMRSTLGCLCGRLVFSYTISSGQPSLLLCFSWSGWCCGVVVSGGCRLLVGQRSIVPPGSGTKMQIVLCNRLYIEGYIEGMDQQGSKHHGAGKQQAGTKQQKRAAVGMIAGWCSSSNCSQQQGVQQRWRHDQKLAAVWCCCRPLLAAADACLVCRGSKPCACSAAAAAVARAPCAVICLAWQMASALSLSRVCGVSMIIACFAKEGAAVGHQRLHRAWHVMHSGPCSVQVV